MKSSKIKCSLCKKSITYFATFSDYDYYTPSSKIYYCKHCDLFQKKVDVISNESINVKEQILQSVISLSYVDSEKGPEEVDLQTKMIEKFGIPQKVANDVEILVKTDNNASGNGLLGLVKTAYHKYKKLIGAQKDVEF